MNSRAFTLSLVIAAIAAFMVWSYIDGMEANYIKKYGKPVPVVVAKVDIKELELIDERKVEIKTVPKQFAQEGHIKSVEEVYNTIATVPIRKGEQITKPRLTQPGSRTGLSNQISIGKRAFAIRVAEERAVSKLIKPGDRIDLVARIEYAPGRKAKAKVKTVLQDVLVLSTGLSITNALPMVALKREDKISKLKLNTYTNYSTMTLEVTPADVQKLIFLISEGVQMFASLRNNDDKSVENLAATRIFDVLGEDAAEAKTYFDKKQRERELRGRGTR